MCTGILKLKFSINNISKILYMRITKTLFLKWRLRCTGKIFYDISSAKQLEFSWQGQSSHILKRKNFLDFNCTASCCLIINQINLLIWKNKRLLFRWLILGTIIDNKNGFPFWQQGEENSWQNLHQNRSQVSPDTTFQTKSISTMLGLSYSCFS